jgi:hypothetical protein
MLTRAMHDDLLEKLMGMLTAFTDVAGLDRE